MTDRTIKDRPSLPTDVVTIEELAQGDRLAPGTLLGSLRVVDVISVKAITPADNDKFAVTFYNQGTLFLHKALLVSVVAEAD
jgi:hypothetical protein